MARINWKELTLVTPIDWDHGKAWKQAYKVQNLEKTGQLLRFAKSVAICQEIRINNYTLWLISTYGYRAIVMIPTTGRPSIASTQIVTFDSHSDFAKLSVYVV